MTLQLTPRIAQRASLVMTTQLQQAICLLQLSNLDLRSFIEKEAEENPFLAVDPGQGGGSGPALPSSRGAADDSYDDIGSRLAAPDLSLYAHVSAQFDVIFCDARRRLIAERFLEALEPNGWLGEPLEDIALASGLTLEQAEDMLHEVQQVEPAGLFARSLAECLALQAEDRGMMTPVFRALLDHLPMLAAADLPGLCRTLGVGMDALRDLLRQLRSLNPKPGADFEQGELTEREPDLIVTRGPEGWRVDLNRSTLPTVHVDETMAADSRMTRQAADYIGERLSVARWLRRAIDHRNQTTLAIGAEIVRRQAAFLEGGLAHLQPMTLRDVAEAVGVHESTVSRVTTGIMMVTPQGTFGLKRLFTTALATAGEGATSSEAVRHRIQQLVRDENPANPLSDDALARIITEEGTHLARRTVAKYRDMLRIASSFERKRRARLAS
jgi:RNA polymerase sigma-54 factor